MNTRYIKILLALVCMSLNVILPANAEIRKWINSSAQISSNYPGDGIDVIANVADGKSDSRYYTGAVMGKTDHPYIQVDLRNNPITISAADAGAEHGDLVVYTQRTTGDYWPGTRPTAFRVQGVFREDNTESVFSEDEWTDICYVYFLYRGNGTHEYSARISLDKIFNGKKGSNLVALRFTVTANNGRKYNKETGVREMSMSEFQIYTLGKTDNYPENLKDRLHLLTDYQNDFKEFKFTNTKGILDESNTITDWEFPILTDNEKNGLKNKGINLPDFNFITSENSPYPLGGSQNRQPAHTIEHILYAVPGDAIALYPYYELPGSGNYQENFSHWYDWETGGRLQFENPATSKPYDLLDFLVDPSEIQITDYIGFLGGSQLPGLQYNVSTPEEYIAVANRINDGDNLKYTVNITADLDFNGYSDVPPIGIEGHVFSGTINGNGHTISNLKVTMDKEGVGLVGRSGDGLRIVNLIIADNCTFIGRKSVGLIGFHIDGALEIKNVKTEATCIATINDDEQKAGGLIGSTQGNDGRITISDCYVGGTIGEKNSENKGGRNNAAISGWIGLSNGGAYCRISKTYVTCVVYGPESENNYIFRTNGSEKVSVESGYCNEAVQGFTALPDNSVLTESLPGWKNEDGKIYPPFESGGEVNLAQRGKANRKTGTFATFFCPRNPFQPGGEQYMLPFKDGRDEFVIAADFSQKFDFDKHVNSNAKEITEPIIAFRHIFRIRDGKTFADEFSGSPENNEEYVRRNQRIVSARANVPFQIRFDSPVPVSGVTRSKYYYKISETDYRRVCGMKIRVFDADTRTLLYEESGSDKDNVDKDNRFYADDKFEGQGVRRIDGINYSLCAGTDSYYRMLKCDSPKEGRYIVQLIGKDINGDVIKIIDSDKDLVVMEYHITFLPESGASMVGDATLYSEDKYKHAREEELIANYGDPKSYVNFDEYRYLEALDNKEKFIYTNGEGHSYVKWPVEWNASNYGFGYDKRYDYNMYMIANHSQVTPYNGAAQKFNNNLAGDGEGLYDRLYYKTKRLNAADPDVQVEKGYFYYVNAATDPGVMARLSIDELCAGSTIHVSAWISEFSHTQPETANLSFNFVAVLKDKQDKPGDRVVLHSFVTGYVPPTGGTTEKTDSKEDLRGEWLNVYYSFVPRLSEFSKQAINSDMVHHYELELDNNCKSSMGADYAIDNIRLYVVKPVVYARQLKPVCDEDQKTTVKVEAPFDVLLQAMGEQEHTEAKDNITIYYTFFDKQKYDKSSNDDKEIFFNETVLKYKYDTSVDSETQTFGKLTFNLNYTSNPDYKESKSEDGDYPCNTAYREISEEGERMIVFHTEPQDKQMSAGKEYIILLATTTGAENDNGPTQGAEYSFFDPENSCAKKCVIRVQSSNVVKVDGVVVEDLANFSVCSKQSPVVQVNVWGINQTSQEFEEVEKNAMMDWFDGTLDEFNTETDGISLKVALETFRTKYPELESVTSAKTVDNLTQDMLDLIGRYTKSSETVGPRLVLHQASYVFPPVKIAEGATESECRVLAIPIVKEKSGMLICASPTELKFKVSSEAPELLHGLTSITYPDDLTDVPLRIGLSQLKSVSGNKNASDAKSLTIPVRKVVRTGSGSATAMQLKTNGEGGTEISDIVLVQTNDPGYRHIGTVDENGMETGSLLTVGIVRSLTAKLGEDNQSGNNVTILFDSDFKFKEGYYYRFRFLFEENQAASSDENAPVCDGQDVFTIKVVPEYQIWTGAANSNFNNDDNWSRVASAHLNKDKDTSSEYLTDGVNTRTFSYAPLDFTKVIIPSSGRMPYLYNPSVDGNGWAENPSVMDNTSYADVPSEGAGEATHRIQYDMASDNGDSRIGCRLWYHNTCDEIHFKPGAELMNQHTLSYNKAWVELETSPDRWYTLSMPLQEVFSGDMYLPSANARQETELFQPITYNETYYDRFKPAVFQRSWNKATANVYQLPDADSGSGASTNVAVKVDWSHVYNDVAEQFGGGAGFSIKTDVSQVKNRADKVLFRLPKDDTSFEYFNQEASISGNSTTITRSDARYKLNPGNGSMTLTGAGDSKYFLAGNPFMAHLDMAKFLKKNADKIAQKYWILTENGQKAAVFDETADGFVGSASGIVAPMQGFFVEAMNDATSLTLVYDESMMRRNGGGTSDSPAVGVRSGDAAGILTITSINAGDVSSAAVLNIGSRFRSPYLEEEDAIALDNSGMDLASTVYTVASGVAMAINRTDDAEGVEIGVIAADDESTQLRFEGVDAVEGLSLYDKATGEMTELYDGMEYSVRGAVAHRLYLTSMLPSGVTTPIEWSVEGNQVTVYAASGSQPTSVNVYDSLGRRVEAICEKGSAIRFNLDSGVYVMDVLSGAEHLTAKIRL